MNGVLTWPGDITNPKEVLVSFRGLLERPGEVTLTVNRYKKSDASSSAELVEEVKLKLELP